MLHKMLLPLKRSQLTPLLMLPSLLQEPMLMLHFRLISMLPLLHRTLLMPRKMPLPLKQSQTHMMHSQLTPLLMLLSLLQEPMLMLHFRPISMLPLLHRTLLMPRKMPLPLKQSQTHLMHSQPTLQLTLLSLLPELMLTLLFKLISMLPLLHLMPLMLN